MKKYYLVKIKVKTETDTGRIKTHTELGVIAAESTEDASFKAREYYGTGMADFDISEVKESNILFILD